MLAQSPLRKILLVIHLWLGLFLGVYFSAVGITGSILVFQDNIQSWQMPEIVSCPAPSPQARQLPLSAIITRLRASSLHPKEDDLARILMPDQEGGAYRIRLNLRQEEKRRMVTVDPYNGQVLRDRLESPTLLGFAHRLHVTLLLEAPGELANGVGGVLVTFLLASGLWLWWPKTRRQLRERLTLRRGVGGARLLLDLHHVFGIYSFGLLFIIALTGALFVFPQPLQMIVARIDPAPLKRKPPKVTPPPGAKRLPVEALVAIAEPISPEVKISSLNYPSELDQPFSCYKRSFVGFFPYINIFIDPYTGKVLKVVDDRTSPVAAKIPRALSTLHFGYWGGLLVKCLYALVGLVPSGLFLTGLLVWWKKKRAKMSKSRA